MIEVAAVPILMKAIDFLFEESSKIFQERRERRMAELGSKKSIKSLGEVKDVEDRQSLEDTNGQVIDEEESSNIIKSKETALNTPVDETAWKNYEAEIRHLLSLLEIYTKNYYLAKEQYAKFGSALVPPIIVHNLVEAEEEVAITTRKLQNMLSKLYGSPLIVQR